MEIAIYEIIHLDWVIPLCELFAGLPHRVRFFTSASFEADIRDAVPHYYGRYEWVFAPAGESRAAFLKRANAFFTSSQPDLILLNSVDAHHLMIARMLRNKAAFVMINLHDVNNFLRAGFGRTPRGFVRGVGKQILTSRADGFLVNFGEMKRYIQTERLTTKPVFVLPPVFSKAYPPSDVGAFTVVVPGSIDERRRDYDLVLRAWEKAGLKNAVLVLAGRPVDAYGARIHERAAALVSAGFIIRYFAGEVPEAEFQSIVSGASLLLSPLMIRTSIHDGIEEEYGRSKFSGNVYDAIRHGKPLVVPSELVVPQDMEAATARYADEDSLSELLGRLATDANERMQLRMDAYTASKAYAFDDIRDRLLAILDSLPLKPF
jgi:hypothetical protein